MRARDRCCVAPACRRTAHGAEIDHTREHAAGGPTVTSNLGAWCSHHHRAKHHARWRVRQPRPGWFTIRTRAGVTHTTRPKKILTALPGPRYAAGPRPIPEQHWPDPAPGEEPGTGPTWRDHLAATFAGRHPEREKEKEKTPKAPPPLDPDDPPPF
ncbi:HNH endonuclease [Actinomycetospora aeridis]|uniref:HNH endonuclease n=1 Tax=Actinomycetospora aeridis TaxID=3129231 RepID=UPI0035A06EA5